MTSKYTIDQALAFIAITASQKGLHVGTRLRLHDYVIFNSDVDKPMYELNEAGMERARRSRLWKAHEALVQLGFKVERHRRARPGYISYYHQDDERRGAFASGRGYCYANGPADPETRRLGKMEKVGSFKNG